MEIHAVSSTTWKPGDPLPGAEHGISRRMFEVIDDNTCADDCWCLTGLLSFGDERAMRSSAPAESGTDSGARGLMQMMPASDAERARHLDRPETP